MGRRRPGDKPLSEPIMVSLVTHIWSLGLNELKSVYHVSIKPYRIVFEVKFEFTFKLKFKFKPKLTRDTSLSGVPDLFDRNKILSGGDLSHYQVPHCIRVFFYFVWFVFIHHNLFWIMYLL